MDWIKLNCNLMDNRKIKMLRRSSGGDTMIVLWLSLLTQAGKCNRGGYLMVSDSQAYSPETLSLVTDIPLPAVKQGLQLFNDLEMIDSVDQAIFVKNWGKYQSEDKLEERRRKDRERKQRQRERERQSLKRAIELKDGSRDDHAAGSRDVPGENRTGDVLDKKTDTEAYRDVVSGTPFLEVVEKDLVQIISFFGRKRVLLASDIAAETWRREGHEIKNPGGYIYALSMKFEIPEWYVPYGSRKAQKQSQLKAIDCQAEFEKSEQEAMAWNELWSELSAEMKKRYQDLARDEFGFVADCSETAILQTAKLIAWRSEQK